MIALVALLGSCYYDHEGILYPETANCTAVATPLFAADVMPILDGRCNNCHAGSFASANIRLDNYQDVVTYVNDGSLMGSIRHAGSFSPMPKNSSKLSACEIDKIQNWINAGSLNN